MLFSRVLKYKNTPQKLVETFHVTGIRTPPHTQTYQRKKNKQKWKFNKLYKLRKIGSFDGIFIRMQYYFVICSLWPDTGRN